MTLFEAIVSGLVQGVTEFFPISSSGHLVILHNIIGLKEPQILFDIFLHAGTSLAIFIVFWGDILDVLTTKKRVGFYILVATIVTGVFVLCFEKRIIAAFGNVKFVGVMMLVTGLWLMAGSFLRYGSEGLSFIKAMMIGLAQGISAIPGISRSGATIATGMFLGIKAQSAAKFSFLLSIPAVIGALLFKLMNSHDWYMEPVYFIGFFVSCLTGILSLKLLLKILNSDNFYLFGIYCIAIGTVVLLFVK